MLGTGETCWMPALFTTISTPPSAPSARCIIAAISSGHETSALL